MRPILLALLLAAPLIAFLPAASAHSCGGTQADCTCPIPNDGAYHSHAGPGGSCSGTGQAQAQATPGGANATPNAGIFLVALAIGSAALIVRK